MDRGNKENSFISIRALTLTAFALASTFPLQLFAAGFEPDLQETIEFIAGPGDASSFSWATVPSSSPELSRHAMPSEPVQALLDEVPGKPFYDLKNPPLSRAWWKYPFYLALGAPRDGVDAVFGFFSFWPIFNIPITLVAYEVVPTQLFMRDPRDWHRWPGVMNKKGHGMLDFGDTPRDDAGWGWFPSANTWKFKYVSKRKVKKLQAKNEALTAQLEKLNKEIEAGNRAIADRQKAARDGASKALDAGDGLEATAWALPYYRAYPTDETARALAINALALHADQGPEWVKPALWSELSAAPLRVLKQAETLLAKTHADQPKRATILDALVLARTRLEKFDGAFEAADAARQASPGDPRLARLAFETALAIRDEAAADEAMKIIAGAPEAPMLRLRLALMKGEAEKVRPQIAELVKQSPDNPYHHYYLGCADLELVGDSETPAASTREATRSLERASQASRNTALADRAARALSYARSLAAEQTGQPKKESKKRGIIDLRPTQVE